MMPLRPLALSALLVLAPCSGRAVEMAIDASVAPAAPLPLAFPIGGTSPDGHTFSANSRYLTLDGKPWFPVMGEFHYSRYPAEDWERELLKLKAGGITVVSTYVFWLHHEEAEGRFDWSGQRDLGRFIQLCAKHGLYVWLRIGPWAHGEARNGGFPDWLVASGLPLRQDDPGYLAQVRRFYGEIARQVHGDFWAQGGPIVGVQIENEYHPAKDGPQHMTTLRQLAIDLGMQAPFYSITGWDRATVPATGYLPVFGGYTDQFWSASLHPLPPNQNFFYTGIRAEDNVMGDLSPKSAAQNAQYDAYPFLTAEMGGGMSIAYHRRPVMLADDSTAAAQVKLGSGITGLGFYMYHGGANPDGRTTQQETLAAWHGYNDMEVKSYDFQAPLGEFGQVNPTYHTIRTLALFLHDFGTELAPMAAYAPAVRPKDRADTATARVAARSDGEHAFVFINNYERGTALPARTDFQVKLTLPHDEIEIPRTPTTIPTGAYPIWPVNLPVGGLNLRYATAEPLARLRDPSIVVFFAWDGIPADFAFDEQPGDSVEATSGRITRVGSRTFVEGVTPGTGTAIKVIHAKYSATHLIVLSRKDALQFWKAPLEGQDRLWLSSANLAFDRGHVYVTARHPADLQVSVYPRLPGVHSTFRMTGRNGLFERFQANGIAELPAPRIELVPVHPAASVPPIRLGPPTRPVALEPSDADFARAAAWTIRLKDNPVAPGVREFLDIAYTGDAARLSHDGHLDDDNFYRGPTWEVGLGRDAGRKFMLSILPLRADAPVYIEDAYRPAFAANGEALALKQVSVEREYEVILTAGPRVSD